MYLHSFSAKGLDVKFREETTGDLDSIWELYSSLHQDSRVMLPPFNHALIERWNASLDEVTFKPILVCIEEDGEERIIGRATLMHNVSPATKHRAELGIVIHDDYQGNGIGSNLVLFMLYVARSKGLKKVILDVFADNDRAVHVFEEAGFDIEGVFPAHYWFRGRFYDVVRMGLAL
jgi:putative acetyltransferase